jgi:putative oxidoreductase
VVSDGGYEYNVVLIAAVLALAELGPGEWSLDVALGTEHKGTGWALAVLIAGALGSAAAIASGKNQPTPGIEQQTEDTRAQSESKTG